jgi:hypothetical protein
LLAFGESILIVTILTSGMAQGCIVKIAVPVVNNWNLNAPLS